MHHMGRYTASFLLVVLFFEICLGLKCYHCNSEDDKGPSTCANATTQITADCEDVFKNPMHTNSNYGFSCITFRGTGGSTKQKVIRSCVVLGKDRNWKKEGCAGRHASVYSFKHFKLPSDINKGAFKPLQVCICHSDGCHGIDHSVDTKEKVTIYHGDLTTPGKKGHDKITSSLQAGKFPSMEDEHHIKFVSARRIARFPRLGRSPSLNLRYWSK